MKADIVTCEWHSIMEDEYHWSGRFMADNGSRGTMYASYDYYEEEVFVAMASYLG